MEITSRVGVAGTMRFNLHALSMAQGLSHGSVKFALNSLAREKLIWRIGQEISLSPPDSKEFVQLEIDMDFIAEVVKKWNKTFKKELPQGIKQTANLTGTVSDCLLTFSKDDIITSIDRWRNYCMSDKWWSKDENKLYRADMFKFFSNSERVNQALNYTGKNSQVVIQKEEAENKDLLK